MGKVGSDTHFFLAYMEIIEKVKEFASNLLKEKGLELLDVIYRREGAGMVLRLIVDKKPGVTLDECGQVNEELGVLLDKDDFIPESYVLEVCSPGLDRPLKTKKDFDRVTGEMVRIITYGPVEDKREHIGRVSSCDEGYVAIELKDVNIIRRIPLDKISKARLEIEF